MRASLALPFVLLPLLAWAQPLPPALSALQSRLDRAHVQLDSLDAKLDGAESAQQQSIAALHHRTVMMLRLAQWPQPLLTAQSLASFSSQPLAANLPGIMRASAHATAARLEASRRQLDDYLRLRETAQGQWQTLDTLAKRMAAQQKRLSRQQEDALSDAALQADQLATLLESRMDVNQPAPLKPVAEPKVADEPLPPPPRAGKAPVHPVPGRPVPAGDKGGVRFATGPGQAVLATLPGKVMYSGPFRNMGGLVITQSGGIYAVYAGLGTLEVNVGQSLAPGARLGAMPAGQGSLYYEVRKGGRAIAIQ
jgi:septal ring factor EnvC (AmiA/AmiB activator)